MALDVAGTHRQLSNTPRAILFLFPLFKKNSNLSTISASSYFALSFSLLPPCHLGAHASLLSHLSPFSPSCPSLLIYFCLPPLFSSSHLPLSSHLDGLTAPLSPSPLLTACNFHIDSEEPHDSLRNYVKPLLSKLTFLPCNAILLLTIDW